MCKVLSIIQKFPDLFYYIYIYIFILISRFNLIKFGENFVNVNELILSEILIKFIIFEMENSN